MRQHHLEHRAQPAGAEQRRGFLDILLDLFQHRLDGAHDEGKADKDQRDHDAERRVGDLQAHGGGDGPDDTVGRVDRGHGDAGHGGRQREGQIDRGVDQPAPRKVVTHQHPGDQKPEDRVDRRSNERGSE